MKPLSGFLELIDKVWFTKVRTDFSHTDLCMLLLKGMEEMSQSAVYVRVRGTKAQKDHMS